MCKKEQYTVHHTKKDNNDNYLGTRTFSKRMLFQIMFKMKLEIKFSYEAVMECCTASKGFAYVLGTS